ncbi:MAG: DUF2330 domain-containing protein [Phycisphaeraceae bacterium]|nr:MAG: DUF2330 domain-containing protein [Phycisphaeraceae bacterium]
MALLALLLSIPRSSAHADGKVFAREGVVATIPDQRALIHFADGVQTLVIETRFESSGSPAGGQESSGESAEVPAGGGDFAWVVPVPSVPELIEVTPGLMPTVAAIFQPSVKVIPSGGPFVFAALLVLAAAFAAVSGRGFFRALAATVLVLLLVTLILLPGLGITRSSMGSGEGAEVSVHDRRLIGHLDVVTISGSDGGLLVSWLNDHGFAVASDSASVIDEYASEGWVFCAARLATGREIGADLSASTPFPLGLRFRTEKPIYPMRLTSTGSRSLAVDLYVFGPAMASAPNFRVIRCGAPREWDEQLNYYSPGHDDAIRVGHEGLLALTRGSRVATKVSATLSPEQMRRDVVIEWVKPRYKGDTVYSRAAALNRAVILGSSIVIAGSLAVLMLTPLLRLSTATAARALTASIPFAATVFLIAWLATPIVSTTPGERYRRYPLIHRLVEPHVWAEMDYDSGDPYRNATVEGVRPILRSAAAKASEHWSLKSEVREEDSPFNYSIGIEEGFITYIGYDQWGRGATIFKILEMEPPLEVPAGSAEQGASRDRAKGKS